MRSAELFAARDAFRNEISFSHRSVAFMTQSVETAIEVPVWDWPVRVVHWAMVLLVVVSLTTGLIGNEMLVWHMRSGETLLALVLFRVIWGFVGSPNARFASFVRGPAAVFATSDPSSVRRIMFTRRTTRSAAGWSSRCCSPCCSRRVPASSRTTTS